MPPHLPYLRRYARALTGSQESGDAYVRARLETVLEAPHEIDVGLPPKIALFQLFHIVWQSSRVQIPDGSAAGSRNDMERSAQRHMQSLIPLHRQALLLVSMEGFSVEETAQVLQTEV